MADRPARPPKKHSRHSKKHDKLSRSLSSEKTNAVVSSSPPATANGSHPATASAPTVTGVSSSSAAPSSLSPSSSSVVTTTVTASATATPDGGRLSPGPASPPLSSSHSSTKANAAGLASPHGLGLAGGGSGPTSTQSSARDGAALRGESGLSPGGGAGSGSVGAGVGSGGVRSAGSHDTSRLGAGGGGAALSATAIVQSPPASASAVVVNTGADGRVNEVRLPGSAALLPSPLAGITILEQPPQMFVSRSQLSVVGSIRTAAVRNVAYRVMSEEEFFARTSQRMKQNTRVFAYVTEEAADGGAARTMVYERGAMQSEMYFYVPHVYEQTLAIYVMDGQFDIRTELIDPRTRMRRACLVRTFAVPH